MNIIIEKKSHRKVKLQFLKNRRFLCGFVGFVNLKKDISKDSHFIRDMNLALKKKNLIKEYYFIDTNINLGFMTNNERDKHFLNMKYNEITYTILFNGQIYNKNEIKVELQELGYEFDSFLDIEILAKAFIHFGTNILKRLNGVFSFVIWNNKTKELFLVRDHFGIKPLYYTIVDNIILFATEIKGILAYPNIEVTITKQGICELFGIRTSTYSRNYCI